MSWSTSVINYFRAHGIDPTVAAQAGVLERDGSLIFPYQDDNGAFERVRCLGGDSKTHQPRGRALSCWWPAGRADPLSEVLVCEGESDALAALTAIHGAGHPVARGILDGIAVVAVPGASFPADRLVAELGGCEFAILASDADKAGNGFIKRATAALATTGITSVRLPLSGGHDLADELAAAVDGSDWLANAIADLQATKAETESNEPVGTPAQQGHLRLLDVAAMVAVPPPPVSWIASPLLARANLTGLYAPGGDGKSLLAGALTGAVGNGCRSRRHRL